MTIPSYFAQITDSRYNVLNYGESGYSAYQGYLFLQLQLLNGINPSAIISYEGVNNSPAHLTKSFSHVRENQIAKKMENADRKSAIGAHFLPQTRALISLIKGADNEKERCLNFLR